MTTSESTKISNLASFRPQQNRLALAWSQSVENAFPGYQKQLTVKGIGQLKMLANKVGAQAIALINFAVEHWVRFAYEASNHHGLSTYPDLPHTGFLLAHHDVAMNMLLQSIAKIERAPTIIDSSKAIARSLRMEKKEKTKLTIEEMNEGMG